MTSLLEREDVFFIEGMICDILDAVENGSFVPTHQVNNVEKNKHTNLWTK